MQYRRLGTSGLRVSVVGLGGNTFGHRVDADGVARIVDAALDVGINFFDTADVYSRGLSEEYLGRALAGRRDRAIIATKVHSAMGEGPNDHGSSRLHVLSGVDASLRRLGTDSIDLLQLHNWDPEVPLEETMAALDDLVRWGKVRYLGCSNFASWQMVWAQWVSDRHRFAPLVSAQPHYSLLHREPEREMIPACRALGIGVIPYFPLAAGMLTGKYREGEPAPEGTRGYQNERFRQRFATPRNFAIVRRLEAWARERDHEVGELAIAWLAAQPMVSTVIAGVTRPEQVRANARAADWTLTPGEAAEVGSLAEA